MTVETFSRACWLLSKMPSSIPWSKDQAELYEDGLQTLPDYLVSDIVHRAIHDCEERPSVATLLRMATEIMGGPIPTAGAAWEEVVKFLITRGLYCDPDPFKANIYREGEPHFSHPVIGNTIKVMGGWRAICTSDAGVDYLRDRFRWVYDDLVEHWSREAPASLPVDADRAYASKRSGRVAVGRT